MKILCCNLLLIAIASVTLGCKRETALQTAASKSSGRPLAEVNVVQSTQQPVTEYREYTGRTATVNTVDVRTRVSGYLLQSPQSKVSDESKGIRSGSLESPAVRVNIDTKLSSDSTFKVLVHEGDRVINGTPLFEIDPAPYQLELSQAIGNLNATSSQLKRFELDLARSEKLLHSNTISKAEYDLAFANKAEAIGKIENLKAVVDRARLNLSYTRINSPIDGVIGRSLVSNGNLVAADTTILTTIVSMDPIYVYFDVDENSLLDYRSRIVSGSVQSARDRPIPVRLGLANEKGYPHAGVIDFVSNTTDPETGNTRMRSSFPNTDGALSSGLFARIQAPFTAEYTAILVPTRALAMDQQGRYLLVVNSDSVVQRRSVVVGTVHGEMSVIREGLEANEMVVVSGHQKAKDGDKVVPKDTSPSPHSTINQSRASKKFYTSAHTAGSTS